MSEENKTLVKRFVSEYRTNHDDTVLYELLSEDFLDHSAMPGLPAGRDGVKALFDTFHTAFADFTAQIDDQVAEQDKVVTRQVVPRPARGRLHGHRTHRQDRPHRPHRHRAHCRGAHRRALERRRSARSSPPTRRSPRLEPLRPHPAVYGSADLELARAGPSGRPP